MHIMLPTYSPRERSIDGFIHGVGLSAAVIAVGVLLHAIIPSHDPLTIAAATIYALGLIAMLSLSAAYNLVRRPDWRETIRRYDHAAIFVMIAGTYTPFTLVSIGGALGPGFLAVVWLIALFGLLLKLLRRRRFERAAIHE
jgi:hemolysin III